MSIVDASCPDLVPVAGMVLAVLQASTTADTRYKLPMPFPSMRRAHVETKR